MDEAAGNARPRPTVLVIDDEDYVGDMIATVLRLEGYQTEMAYNGRDGLALALGARADLLIVDIMMPYLSGTKLVAELRAARAELAGTPVILISAGAKPADELPGVRFLAKPFEINTLMELVQLLIGPGDPA
ncbi:MAG TPA: response regulator [Herpetosiphonaceae bacterium]